VVKEEGGGWMLKKRNREAVCEMNRGMRGRDLE